VTDNAAEPVVARTRQARTFIVMNPVAGTTDADAARTTIDETLRASGIDYEIYVTRKDDNISKIVTQALDNGFQRVAAIGGDGTVSLVAAALVNRQIPLGILPAGSGNVLARDLGIPLALPDALELFISYERIRTLDAMQVGEKFYFLNVSAGISSLTMQRTKRQDKRRFGMLAYLWRALEQLRRFRPHTFRLVVDGQSMTLPASEVLIANASFMGINPYFNTKREICPDDGVADLCVVLSRKIGDIPALAFELITRHPLPKPTLECQPVKKEVTLDALRRLPVQADGELAGYTPVQIKIIPNALQVIVPNL
jgi:YegS/Rv2252/BmrU family lipid kinase